MQKLKKFFWYCAGARENILIKAPNESEKYVGIGATVFFTGIFAALSSAYALYTVFDNYLVSIAFGVLWGLMIFNLDRFIVSSMRKRSSVWNEFLMAGPRLVLAILISIVIAKPLELKVFEKEIDSELVNMQQEERKIQEDFILEKYASRKQILKNEIAELETEIRIKTNERNRLAEIARKEADGTGGTGLRNAGPIYKIKKADAERVNSELIDLRSRNLDLVNVKQAELNALDSNIISEIAALKKSEPNGPAARLEALNRLSQKSEAIGNAVFFITLLFILIECAPIIVKLISRKGSYDYLLEAQEYKYQMGVFRDKAFIHSEIKKDSDKLPNTEKDFVFGRLDIHLEKL